MHAHTRIAACLAGVVLASGCAGGGTPMALMSADRTVASARTASPVAAFFNDQAVTIFIIPLSPSAAAQVLAHNKNVNIIYEASGFKPVINEIQGPGFNPLWQVVTIAFNAGTTPTQFTSQAAILDAQSKGQITLTFTNMVDTVPVVGSGGK